MQPVKTIVQESVALDGLLKTVEAYFRQLAER
jgi:hypothetical protein